MTASTAAMALLLFLGGELRAGSFAYWTAKAEKAVVAKNDEEALKAYASALEAWKKADGKKSKVKAFLARTAIHEKRQDWPNAVVDLTSAMVLDAKNPLLHHRRGKAYLQQSLLAKAMDDFYKAISLKLNFREAYFDRARCYELYGDAKFAKEDYRAACRLGYKEACRRLSQKKAATKTSAQLNEEEEPAGEEEPSSSRKTSDFSACIRGLERCIDAGGSFDGCVQEAPLCDERALPHCCPAACVSGFKRALNDGASQADTFRNYFSRDSSCKSTR